MLEGTGCLGYACPLYLTYEDSLAHKGALARAYWASISTSNWASWLNWWPDGAPGDPWCSGWHCKPASPQACRRSLELLHQFTC